MRSSMKWLIYKERKKQLFFGYSSIIWSYSSMWLTAHLWFTVRPLSCKLLCICLSLCSEQFSGSHPPSPSTGTMQRDLCVKPHWFQWHKQDSKWMISKAFCWPVRDFLEQISRLSLWPFYLSSAKLCLLDNPTNGFHFLWQRTNLFPYSEDVVSQIYHFSGWCWFSTVKIPYL